MTQQQEDAVYSAYMGICVLSIMCRKAGFALGRSRAEELLRELAEAFPEVHIRVLTSTFRKGDDGA